MATAARYDFTIEQGATFKRIFTLLDENNDPIDVTSATAVLKARKNLAGAAILDLSVGNGITMGGTDGRITVELTDTETAALTIRQMIYDMLVDFGTEKNRVIQGEIKLALEVSF